MRLPPLLNRFPAKALAACQFALASLRSVAPARRVDPRPAADPLGPAEVTPPLHAEAIPYSAIGSLPLDLTALLYESAHRLTAALRSRQAQVVHDECSSLAYRIADLSGLEPLRSALQELAVAGLGSAPAVLRVRPLLEDAQDHLLRRLNSQR